MIVLLQSVAATVPVKLIDDVNQPYGTNGVLPSQLRCYISKEDGVSRTKGISSTNWLEVSKLYQTGEYRLFFEAGELDQIGFLTFTISGRSIVDCAQWVYILPVRSPEIYDRIGAPAGASVSADIASVKADIASVHSTVGTIKQAVMGKQKLDLSVTPPRHYIYDTVGNVLQQAQVSSNASERTYDPL